MYMKYIVNGQVWDRCGKNYSRSIVLLKFMMPEYPFGICVVIQDIFRLHSDDHLLFMLR